MANRKTKPARRSIKSAPNPAVEQRAAHDVAAVGTGSRDTGRLLREAAWSAMFGRVEAKNPFTR